MKVLYQGLSKRKIPEVNFGICRAGWMDAYLFCNILPDNSNLLPAVERMTSARGFTQSWVHHPAIETAGTIFIKYVLLALRFRQYWRELRSDGFDGLDWRKWVPSEADGSFGEMDKVTKEALFLHQGIFISFIRTYKKQKRLLIGWVIKITSSQSQTMGDTRQGMATSDNDDFFEVVGSFLWKIKSMKCVCIKVWKWFPTTRWKFRVGMENRVTNWKTGTEL